MIFGLKISKKLTAARFTGMFPGEDVPLLIGLTCKWLPDMK